MGIINYSGAVHQIAVRGYPVREVSQRLGVSTHSLYKSMKLFGEPVSKANSIDHETENRRLKRELAGVTEERDIKNRQRCCTLPEGPNEVGFTQGASRRVRCPGHVPGTAGPFFGFLAWSKKPLSHRAQENIRQTELIRQAWSDSGKVYGFRKLTDNMCDRGERIAMNPHRVPGRDHCAGRLQEPPWPLRREANHRGREQAGSEIPGICA